MGNVVVVIVVLVVVGAVGAWIVRNRRRAVEPTAAPVAPKVRPPDEPMTGLESALAEVVDRDGRPLRDRIDAEATHVDELRVPDDTGPLLRRALDHVSHSDTAHSGTAHPDTGHPDTGGADAGRGTDAREPGER